MLKREIKRRKGGKEELWVCGGGKMTHCVHRNWKSWAETQPTSPDGAKCPNPWVPRHSMPSFMMHYLPPSTLSLSLSTSSLFPNSLLQLPTSVLLLLKYWRRIPALHWTAHVPSNSLRIISGQLLISLLYISVSAEPQSCTEIPYCSMPLSFSYRPYFCLLLRPLSHHSSPTSEGDGAGGRDDWRLCSASSRSSHIRRCQPLRRLTL